MKLYRLEQFGEKMNKEKTLGAIRASNVFGEVSKGALERLLSCETKKYVAGEFVSEDDKRSLGIVLSGRFNILSADGNRVLMNTASAGSAICAATVFLDGAEISEICSATKGEILFVPRATVEELFCAFPETGVGYARFLSEKVLFLNKKILSFTSPRADVALASYIVENERNGTMKLNISAASRRLCVGRTTLYRALSALEQDGIISYEKGIITVTDAIKLASRRKKI